MHLLKTKQAIGLVDDSEDLVEGMAEYFKDIGIGTSVLDFDEVKEFNAKF